MRARRGPPDPRDADGAKGDWNTVRTTFTVWLPASLGAVFLG